MEELEKMIMDGAKEFGAEKEDAVKIGWEKGYNASQILFLEAKKEGKITDYIANSSGVLTQSGRAYLYRINQKIRKFENNKIKNEVK